MSADPQRALARDERRRLATQREVSLVEILDRALGAGVVIAGDVTLSLADVDLVDVHVRLVVGSTSALRGERLDSGDTAPAALPAAAEEAQ
jgi:hypothetical protein